MDIPTMLYSRANRTIYIKVSRLYVFWYEEGGL